MTPTLTPAAGADYAFTHDLTRDNMRGYVERFWGAWDEAVYRANYARTDNLILRLGDERVGFVRLFAEDGRLVLEDLQVLPAYQNRGLGTWALGQVEAIARERGLAAVRLRCFHTNPAYRLYRRCGFAVVESGEHADWLEKPA